MGETSPLYLSTRSMTLTVGFHQGDLSDEGLDLVIKIGERGPDLQLADEAAPEVRPAPGPAERAISRTKSSYRCRRPSWTRRLPPGAVMTFAEPNICS